MFFCNYEKSKYPLCNVPLHCALEETHSVIINMKKLKTTIPKQSLYTALYPVSMWQFAPAFKFIHVSLKPAI